MTVSYSGIAGLFGAAVTAIICHTLGFSGTIILYPSLIVGAAAGMVAWTYSPLPDSNGGIGSSDPLRGRYWGLNPGQQWKSPNYVAPHETKERAIYYYDDRHLAIDIDHGVKAWGDSPDAAKKNLEQSDIDDL